MPVDEKILDHPKTKIVKDKFSFGTIQKNQHSLIEEVRLKNLIMNSEITELTAIIFANLLDVIPLISNTNDRTESSLLNIYYRNAAYFQNMNQELLIEHPEEINIME